MEKINEFFENTSYNRAKLANMVYELEERPTGGAFSTITGVNWSTIATDLTTRTTFNVPDDVAWVRVVVARGEGQALAFYTIPWAVIKGTHNFAYLKLSWTNEWCVTMDVFTDNSFRIERDTSSIYIKSIELGVNANGETIQIEKASYANNNFTFPSAIFDYDFIFAVTKNDHTGVTLIPKITSKSFPIVGFQDRSNGSYVRGGTLDENATNKIVCTSSVNSSSEWWGVKVV